MRPILAFLVGSLLSVAMFGAGFYTAQQTYQVYMTPIEPDPIVSAIRDARPYYLRNPTTLGFRDSGYVWGGDYEDYDVYTVPTGKKAILVVCYIRVDGDGAWGQVDLELASRTYAHLARLIGSATEERTLTVHVDQLLISGDKVKILYGNDKQTSGYVLVSISIVEFDA